MNGVAIPVLGQHHKGSFQPGGMRHVVDFGGTGLKMAGAAKPRLAQTPAQDWLPMAQAAVKKYDQLLQVASRIANADARGQVLLWLGRADVPGSPAERYTAVVRDISQAQVSGWEAVYGTESPIARDRAWQLEKIVEEFGSRVTGYDLLPASTEAGSTSEFWDKSTLCVAGSIALLALVVVPLLLD